MQILRCLSKLLILTYLLSSGCLYIPYSYSVFEAIPPLQLSLPIVDSSTLAGQCESVHAFRVEVKRNTNSTWGMPVGWRLANLDWRLANLSEITISSEGVVPAQVKSSLTTGHIEAGFYILGGLQWLGFEEAEEILLRLYRPGYKLIEIKPGQAVGSIEWQIAKSLDDQETALDKLCPPEGDGQYLAPGYSSPAHRRALEFAAAEYERLAGHAQSQERVDALLSKAKRLRELAKI